MDSDKSKESAGGNGSTILIVDDDDGHSSLMQKCLQSEGFRIVRTATCGKAIEWLNENTADLMLLDHKLPDMTGREMLRHLAKGKETIAFVVVSSQGDERVVVDMMRAGALDYIVKDTSFLQLLPSVVARAIEQVRQQERLVLAEEMLKWESAVNSAIAQLSSALLKPSTSIEDISNLLLEHAKGLTGSQFGYVGYIDPDTGSLICPTLTKDVWEQCQISGKSITFEKFGGLWGWVLENKKSIMVNSVKDDPRSTGAPKGHIPIENFLSAPCVIHDELVGQVALANRTGDYTDRDLLLVERLAEFYGLVIQRKRSEEALQKTTNTLNSVLDSATEFAIAATDLDFRILHYNPAAEKMFGYKAEEVIGKTVQQMHTKENVEPGRFDRAIEILKETGKYEYGIEFKTNRGTERHAYATVMPMKDDNGVMNGYILFARDVTEHKLAEKALQESEERFRQAITGAPLPIMIHAQDGEVIRINDTWTELTGYTHSDIPTISDWVLRAYGDKSEALRSVIDKLYTLQRSTHEGAYPIITSTGQTLIWDFSSAPLGRLADGRQLVITMALDITEQKQAEEDITQLAKFPSENPNFVLRIAKDGTLLYANEVSISLLEEWDCPIGQTVPEQWCDIISAVFESNENERVELEHDNRLYAIMVVPVAQGGYANLYGRDITERKEAELGLLKAHDELEGRIKERTTQLQKVVADLQDEVTERIRAEEKILQDQQQLRELAAELMLTEERERREIAMTLHDSIGQILAFSSIELANFLKSAPPKTGKPLAKVRKMIEQAIAETRALTFDLSPTILYTFGLDAAMEQLSEQFSADHGFDCSLDICEHPRPVSSAVQILLYRAVKELLVNTVKHAKARNVKISSNKTNNCVEIIVEDDGDGFDLFSIDATKGKFNGLGLFSIRERLTHLGGQMHIESKPGKGTRITLLAPMEEE